MQRFWNKVQKGKRDECWLWLGGINSTGRGIFWFNGNSVHAHRVAWILTNGPIPQNKWILHHCDNGPCVNPKHLFIGDHAANMRDMIAKGRQADQRGENSHRAKLASSQVKKIRRRWKPYIYSQQKLANEYGVSRSAIQAVLDGRNWKHILS
jgi:DNA-binding XRE family transcriptional regulator